MVLSENELATRMSTVEDRYGDRLSQEDLQSMLSPLNAGEWLMAFVDLVGGLARTKALISTTEAGELRAYLETLASEKDPMGWAQGMVRRSREWLDQIPVIPSLSQAKLVELASTLPETYANRLPAGTMEYLTGMRDDQEWDDLIESLVDVLRKRRVPISAQERQDLWLLLESQGLPAKRLVGIPVV